MTTPPLRAALATTLGLALALPLAAVALAGGGKTTPPPKGSAPAPAAKYSSLEDLEAAADKVEADAHRELRKQRYDKVLAYLKANPTAKDAEAAQVALFNLAEENEEWAKVVQHADEYLAAHAEGEQKLDALVSKAGALGNLGKTADAKTAYEAATKVVDPQKYPPQVVFNVWTAYVNFLVDADDVEGAKTALQGMKDAFAGHQAAGQVAQLAEGTLKDLDAIGTEATAFPEGQKDLDGKPVGLADFKGKILLIDFWATWCGPCRAELPNVIAAYKKYHDKGFEIVGVSLDQAHSADTVKQFVKEKAMPWRQVYDPNADRFQTPVAVAYGVQGIPHTVLVDKDGKVLRVGLRGEALQKKLAKLLDAKK